MKLYQLEARHVSSGRWFPTALPVTWRVLLQLVREWRTLNPDCELRVRAGGEL